MTIKTNGLVGICFTLLSHCMRREQCLLDQETGVSGLGAIPARV